MAKLIKYLLHNKLALIGVIILINILIYSVCFFSSQISGHQNSIVRITNLKYNSTNDKPVSGFAKLPLTYKKFSINFEADFFPTDDNYSNIFQTANDPKTMRIELTHPSKLQVVIGYSADPLVKVYPISSKVKMNKWNHVKVDYAVNKTLYVKLNNEKPLYFNDKKLDPKINNLILASGFSNQRIFSGSIKNATFSMKFNQTNFIFYFLGLLSEYYLVILFSQIVFVLAIYLLRKIIKSNDTELKYFLYGFLVTFSILSVIVLLSGAIFTPMMGKRKWIPYLAVIAPSIILGLNYLMPVLLKNRILIITSGLVTLTIFIFGIFNYDLFSWMQVTGILLLFCSLAVIPFMKSFSFIFAGGFIFLYSLNSIIFINFYGTQNYIQTALTAIIVLSAFMYSLIKQTIKPIWVKINTAGFVLLMIISAFLVFRTDSFFLGSAEYHWNYYTGVIQTLRSGGELLWSAPSQYGLLNILIPTILPWTSRNSFFIFQAVLFLICTLIILRTIFMSFKNSAAFILISLTSLSLFYFADPSLIGPAPFPSSSAMRFLWCYILLFTILIEFRKRNLLNNNIKWVITGAYILGCFWSAESMFYCSAIYFSFLITSAVSMFKSKKGTTWIYKFLLNNIPVLILAFIIMNILYIAITGHMPDWSMYLMYAFNYALGYGELIFMPWGLHWAIIITMSGMVFVLSRLYAEKKYQEWIIGSVCFISLWIISSYYVGRAVSNNLTALLPLIFYIFIILISGLMKSKLFTYRLLLYAVFLPWIITGVIGGIGNPQFFEKVRNFKFFENINSKSFRPDNDLGQILKSLNTANGTRIVYYGDPHSNPVISTIKGVYMDPTAGMPFPLTLLEEPIPEERRNVIIDRFLSKVKEPVYFIYKKDEKLTRIILWKKFLENKYNIKNVNFTGSKYAVLKVLKKL